MQKIKYFFLLFLCLSLFGTLRTVSAQTKADVDGMVEFYEWAFETDFAPEQRDEFQRIFEQNFRKDSAKRRKNTDIILQTFADIKNANSEARRETRKLYLQGFLPKLKAKEQTDDEAHFLLEVYRASHGGKDEFTDMDAALGDTFDKSADKAPVVADSKSLFGKWFRTTGSGSITDGTGKTKYGSGTNYFFEFFADGTIEYTVESKTLSIMQCRIESAQKARGKFSTSGDSMTMNLGPMSDSGTNSCNAKENYKKTLEPSTLSVKFQVKKMESIFRPDNPTVLCFDGGDGDACFERVNQ